MKKIDRPSDNLIGKIESFDVFFEIAFFLTPIELICLMLTAKFYHYHISKNENLWQRLNEIYFNKNVFIPREKVWREKFLNFLFQPPQLTQYDRFRKSYSKIWNHSFFKPSQLHDNERSKVVWLFIKSAIVNTPAPIKVNHHHLNSGILLLLLQLVGTRSENVLLNLLQTITSSEIIVFLGIKNFYSYLKNMSNYQFLDKVVSELMRKDHERNIIRKLANHMNPRAFSTLSKSTLQIFAVYTSDLSLLTYYYLSPHFDENHFIPFSHLKPKDCCTLLMNVSQNLTLLSHLLKKGSFVSKLTLQLDYLQIFESLKIYDQGEFVASIVECLNRLGVMRRNLDIQILMSHFYRETYDLLPVSTLEILLPYAQGNETIEQIIQDNIAKQKDQAESIEENVQRSWYFPTFRF